MKHKSIKQIKEEVKEVNSEFKKNIEEINANGKEYRARTYANSMQKSQASWDKLNEKQVKIYNIFIRSVGVASLIVGLMCVLIDPIAIFLVIAGIFFVRFDANKRKSEYKEMKKQEKNMKKK